MRSLGVLLEKRLREAIDESAIHRKALDEFTDARGEDTQRWVEMIQNWEAELVRPVKDRKAMNPYESTKSGEFHFVYLPFSCILIIHGRDDRT